MSPGGGPDSSISGLFSSVRRTGRWQVPERLTLTQGFSEVALDFREAVVSSPVVELIFYGGFSECQIIVPPGVHVEWAGGTSIFSEQKDEQRGQADPRMWRLRITHQGAFNEIRVRTLGLGEDEPKWWKKLGLG